MDNKIPSLWDQMIDCQLGLLAGLDQELAAVSLNSLTFEVLRLLAAAPENKLKLADLAQGVRHSQSGTTRLVDRLEKDGVLKRLNCATDRRVIYAELTPAGRQAYERGLPLWENWLGTHLEKALTQEEREQYFKLLTKISRSTAGIALDGACPSSQVKV